MKDDETEKQIRKAAEAGRIEFAPSESVDAFGDLAYDVIEVAFGVSCAFISDGTDLTDFLRGELVNGNKTEALEAAYARIEEHFGVDVRGEFEIVAICRKIAAAPTSIN